MVREQERRSGHLARNTKKAGGGGVGVHLVENGMDIFVLHVLLGHHWIYSSFRVAEMAVGSCRES